MSKYFRSTEVMCRCGCGQSKMNDAFMLHLDELRQIYGRPIIISSGYRCPEHNTSVSSTGINGPHTTGRAVDIKVAGEDAYTIVRLAMALGFTGIGIKQSGEYNKRFIHIDMLQHELRPRIWSY